MNLFEPFHQNVLPKDGKAIYFGPVLSSTEANRYFQVFLDTIEWKQDELILFGKKITTQRKVAWYGNKAYEYTYSNTKKTALLWTPELLSLKSIAEKLCQTTFNACLLNLYHSGTEAMGWHSDDEPEITPQSTIASLSLGSDRKFVFKHKESKHKVEVILQNGSLLSMEDETQTKWLHALPPSKKITRPRINLTFRSMRE